MVDPKSLKYRNITISGLICVGSSTLAFQLEEILGWKYWNAGQFFRDYCKTHNLKLENTSDRSDELSRKVDYGMREDLKEKSGLILEGWLSGFVAQGVKGVLKILLYCDDGLRIDRFVNREAMGVEESKEHIFKREHENSKKWSRVYKKEWERWVPEKYRNLKTEDGFLDFWHPKLYDLAIDTYKYSKEEVLAMVLKKLEYKE